MAEIAVLAELANEGVLMHACRQRAQTCKRTAADAAADEMTHLLPLVRPEEGRARAHTDNDRVLFARKGKSARADRGELRDLDGLHTVNITLNIRSTHAGKRDMADIGELKAVRG